MPCSSVLQNNGICIRYKFIVPFALEAKPSIENDIHQVMN